MQPTQIHRDNRTEFDPRRSIVIVGAGFTGTMLAVQLLRAGNLSVRVVLIDSAPKPGGVAYGTRCDGHLLNVPAKNMSAYADIPDDFLKWVRAHYSCSARGDDFLPRSLYGEYIASQLRDAAKSPGPQFQYIYDQATSLEVGNGMKKLRLASGKTVVADKVVLALGNFPPGALPFADKVQNSSRYISNPWALQSIDLQHDRHILVIGSGLTSVDVVIELRARGYDGRIHLLSRRGLLPQSHKQYPPIEPFRGDGFPLTVRGLLRFVRSRIAEARAQGSDWRAVIDSLRPQTQEIWRKLPQAERRRFLRHLRSYWEVHRHRVAERVLDEFMWQLRNGDLVLHAGRVAELREDEEGVIASYRARNTGKMVKVRADRLFNCTGPEGDCRRVNNSLLMDLIEKRLARPDELYLGLDVSENGAVQDAHGRTSDFLYAAGPLCKGALWETTAVPEIRRQVVDLANLLLRGAGQDIPHAATSRLELGAAGCS
ncbi:MAG TPA: FAD/NAD(P)-binding protein [Terriglobales bacterium]|nr:FAD/NAD(P)-binding protein [Terriglobales bacterium]